MLSNFTSSPRTTVSLLATTATLALLSISALVSSLVSFPPMMALLYVNRNSLIQVQLS